MGRLRGDIQKLTAHSLPESAGNMTADSCQAFHFLTERMSRKTSGPIYFLKEFNDLLRARRRRRGPEDDQQDDLPELRSERSPLPLGREEFRRNHSAAANLRS